MITVILENRNGEEVTRTFRLGNEAYLIRNDDFELLGGISEVEYDVFSAGDMPKLLRELTAIKAMLERTEEAHHIDEIISLADTCRFNTDLVLTFTPFE